MKKLALVLAALAGLLSSCVVYDGPNRHGYRDGAGYDRDRDGVPNRYDRDRDGDGIPNRYDRRPNDSSRY